MRGARIWVELLGLQQAVVEDVELDEDAGVLVVSVRVPKRAANRCGRCRRPCRRFDAGRGVRRWRALDVGSVRAFVQAAAPRVQCRRHGVVVAAVPWARHDAGHTLAFDEQVAWLAVHTSRSAVAQLMRVAWRTVGVIVERVTAGALTGADRFAGLARIGIDEISYKRGHKYLTVVVDHDTGRLVWAAPGRDKETLRGFFDALGPERSASITHVSADGANWIATVVAQRCANAVRCADPFHVVQWASKALDEERRGSWNRARGAVGRDRSLGRAPAATGGARSLKGARWALWRNPEDLSENQAAQLGWIARTDPRLHRAYLLKEGLRMVFRIARQDGPGAASQALDRWIGWARRCRIPAFVALSRNIIRHRPAIEATFEHGLSNGLVESMNTKIRVLTRVAFGFHSSAPLVGLAMLALGGFCPPLPGRGGR
ncbi:ISL3 family transposase [Kineococcus sp. NBC_00420]|uniref:ISL3 family transposase n=1 Tax=Kineococcus sp. NBC_00420 TaxID=2903564 RepID=UPI002E1AB08C